MTEAQVQVAYALWRKKTIVDRQGSASLRLGLNVASLAVGWLLFELEIFLAWYLLAALPLSISTLIAMVDQINADRVPSWSDLKRDYEYEAWKIEEEAKARTK